jgi:hypothetical protein
MANLDTITITKDNENVFGPYQNILKSDTFNEWRRKTNGLNELIKSVAEGVSDQTITIETDTGLLGGGFFTLNDDDSKYINIELDETIVATRSFVSESVGKGVITLQAGPGVSIDGNRNIDLNSNQNRTITINSDATADIADIVGYTGELFQTAYFTGNGSDTDFSLDDQPGFQNPTPPGGAGPITTRPGGYIVTIDGVYQIPGDNGEVNNQPTSNGAYWIRDNGDSTYELVFISAPPNGSKICISSVISYNDKLGVNNSTISIGSTGAISGGGSFDLNQQENESLVDISLNIDAGLLSQANRTLTLADLSSKHVLGNLGSVSAPPTQVTVDTSITDSSSDTHLVTAKGVKDYVDTRSDGIRTVTLETPFGAVRTDHSIEHGLGGVPNIVQKFVRFNATTPGTDHRIGELIPLYEGTTWSGTIGQFGTSVTATHFKWGHGGPEGHEHIYFADKQGSYDYFYGDDSTLAEEDKPTLVINLIRFI